MSILKTSKRFIVSFTTPTFPDKEDAERWVVYGKDEEDVYNEFAKRYKSPRFYYWQVEELLEKDTIYQNENFTQII
jgi:hypothetical protein